MGQAPATIRMLTKGQILEVVRYVFTLRDVFTAASHS
jgi:hypothetical protein